MLSCAETCLATSERWYLFKLRETPGGSLWQFRSVAPTDFGGAKRKWVHVLE